jgi:hypothetical protein
VPFKSGENLRILEQKGGENSKGNSKFSTDTYKMSDNTGYKISVTNDYKSKLQRKFKPAELLKINKVDKPIRKEVLKLCWCWMCQMHQQKNAGQLRKVVLQIS